MPTTSSSHKLNDQEWALLEERADRFAAALQKGAVGDWEQYLEGLPAMLRRPVVLEMVKIELEHRWAKGEMPLLEEYASRFPEITDAGRVPNDLICEEFRIRCKRGHQPELSSYRSRFPQQFVEIASVLERAAPVKKKIDETAGREGESVRMMGTIVSTPMELQKQLEPKEEPKLQKPDNYQKTEKLGAGHFGEVWKAKAPGGIEVAIKVVTQPIERDAAQRELQALELVKNLRHPCVLSTLAFWIEEGRLHIVMELADGTMRDRIKQCQAQNLPGIPRDELLMYFADAAEGLDFLHAHKVFHRDIKPDNILLLHGHAKVADFGLARLQEQQMMSVSFAGTPVYMAPESWGGKGGPRSDQYSLAFAYAELRQGRRPIEGSDFTEVMTKTLENNADLDGIPPEEAKVVRRALSKKPEDRFMTCCEFVFTLARAAGSPLRIRSHQESDLMKDALGGDGNASTVNAEDLKSKSSAGVAPKRMSPFVIAAGLLVLVGAAVGIWQLTKGDGKPTNTEVVDGIYVPPQFTSAANAKVITLGSRKLYDRIIFKLKNGEEALFVLINPAPPDKPFYMMEGKVWNSFFDEFAFANPDAVRKTEWQRVDPHQPAVRIRMSEALAFAHWLGGKLPTTKQWDEAAGIHNRAGRDGPSLKEGTAAIGIEKPRSFNEAVKDYGPNDLRDMAGNGREFTLNVLTAEGAARTAPLERPTAQDLVILRGRNFTLTKPLSYTELDQESKVPQTQFYVKGSPYTSFRVVLELPNTVDE